MDFFEIKTDVYEEGVILSMIDDKGFPVFISLTGNYIY